MSFAAAATSALNSQNYDWNSLANAYAGPADWQFSPRYAIIKARLIGRNHLNIRGFSDGTATRAGFGP